MWNPTTNTNDIKKSDDVVEPQQYQQPPLLQQSQQQQIGVNIEQSQQQYQQQQQLNIFPINSKLQAETEAAAEKGVKNFEEQIVETIDSGFISGPQSEYQHDYEQESDQEEKVVEKEKEEEKLIKLSSKEQQQQQQQKQQRHYQQDQEINYLDSGCIAEYEGDEDDDDDDEENENDNIVSDVNEAKLDKVEINETNKSIGHNIANTSTDRKTSIKSDSAITELKPAVVVATTDNNEQMLITDVPGLSDRFGRYILQNDTDAVQHTPGMNNLNNSNVQRTGSVASTSTIATTATTASTSSTAVAASSTAVLPNRYLTPSNAWEEFYKQNDDGDTPLHLACISGEVDVVIALLRIAPHPTLFNIQNDIAQTPLHLSALTKHPRLLRMLLLAGAEPTIRDRHGNTALHIACNYGDVQCVKALTNVFSPSEIDQAHRSFGHRTPDKMSVLGYKNLPSDLEICNYDGERCVHLAAQQGHIEILRILKDQGADINAREGKSGLTPLHIAIEGCNEDLANFLLDECEKLNLETATYAGLTAYQVAIILNKSQMQNILKNRGAELLSPPESDYEYDSDYDIDLDDSKMYDRFGDPGYFVAYSGGVKPMCC